MPLLDKWKAAKKAFETATGKKKPSEKALGVFRKSSGLEEALKKLDGALAKKVTKEVANAKENYRKTFETYCAVMERSAQAEKDANYQKEVIKLAFALDTILEEAKKAEDALETDPKVLVSILEAIGP